MPTQRVIQVEWLEKRLAEIEENIQYLAARRDVYRELLEAAESVDIGDKESKRAAERESIAEDRAPKPRVEPSTAIDELVEKEPGLTRKEIADRVENTVASDAKNVRAVLFTHMRRREQAGEFFKDGRGRLYPKDHPVAAEARSDARDHERQGGGGGTLLERI